MKGWTYGAEFELGDLDRRKPTLRGYGWDVRDVTMVNSNGIAVDPRAEVYKWGGEVNTPAFGRRAGLVGALEQVKEHYPEAAVNYRSNLHIHVRVPGLRDNLPWLKSVLTYTNDHLRDLLSLVEPIPAPASGEYPHPGDYAGARKRYARRRVSHQTVLPAARYVAMMAADTVDKFFLAEFHQADKRFAYIQPRAAVNLRQLTETDTVEFRHFPMTLSSKELAWAVEWCEKYLTAALLGHSPESLKGYFAAAEFPTFQPFCGFKEDRFRRTVRGAAHWTDNINLILGEDNANPETPPCYCSVHREPK